MIIKKIYEKKILSSRNGYQKVVGLTITRTRGIPECCEVWKRPGTSSNVGRTVAKGMVRHRGCNYCEVAVREASLTAPMRSDARCRRRHGICSRFIIEESLPRYAER